MIKLIGERLNESDIDVKQATEDADLLTVTSSGDINSVPQIDANDCNWGRH